MKQRSELEDQTVEDIVKGLRRQFPGDDGAVRIPPALEKILDDRNMKELLNLLMRQYKEKADSLKDSVMKLME